MPHDAVSDFARLPCATGSCRRLWHDGRVTRWWLSLVLVIAFCATASAGVFKPRGGGKTSGKKPAATAKKTTKPAKPAAKKSTAAKRPAKKTSKVASKGRPDDLTPDPETKPEVAAVEDEEEDVIIRDDDD